MVFPLRAPCSTNFDARIEWCRRHLLCVQSAKKGHMNRRCDRVIDNIHGHHFRAFLALVHQPAQ
eukprot:285698-Amphidinium_carterae.2